ncbi:hypothetical protein XdyCFBP7245_09745 [Xanthomonas dyei]|uniref:Uncharacterized protein n=1 Tax=Xanthomonas dyei TaxID=743699 RepID=A0A2S7C4B0_9XANT|nr:hypothetical protein XdyCFBP7245_09745 [Xanthomonas dyei]
MNAAKELTWTYLQRVLRWWAGKGALQQTRSIEGAAPSPLAGHAVNPSLGARWRHPCRQRSRNRRGHRTREFAGGLLKSEEPDRTVANCSVETLCTDRLDWSLPAHRRRTLGGMDAATELTRTYLQRVL